MTPTWQKISHAIQVLEEMPEEIRQSAATYKFSPLKHSLAFHELEDCLHEGALEVAYGQGAKQLLHVSSDHMSGLKRTLDPSPGVLSLVPWTCARGALESCSTSVWLLDNTIDPIERITRSLNLRLQEQHIQRKLAKKDKDGTQPGEIAQGESDITRQTEARICHFSAIARQLGIAEKKDKRGRLIGFGSGPVSISARIGSTHGSELDYAMLSSTAHGNEFATLSLGSKIVGHVGDGVIVVPDLQPLSALYLVFLVSEWFSRATWTYFGLFGWDLRKLESILEEGYDRAAIDGKFRFWRS